MAHRALRTLYQQVHILEQELTDVPRRDSGRIPEIVEELERLEDWIALYEQVLGPEEVAQ